MGGVSDSDNLPLHHAPEIGDGSKTEEIDELEAEDVVPVLDDGRPLTVNRTYYINCQTVYSMLKTSRLEILVIILHRFPVSPVLFCFSIYG